MKTFSSLRSAIIRLNRWAIALTLFSLTWLIGCDDWFDDHDDDDNWQNGAGAILADRIDTPWEMAFTPDGRLLVTQRPGAILSIRNGDKKMWLNLDSVVEEVGESGLFGIAIDPDFEENRFVYISYTYAASKAPLKLVNKIVRYREYSNSEPPVFDHVLLDNVEGNYLHNMGALEFGPDNMLYVTSGERFLPALAQDLSTYSGKILRMTREGEVPADNPFPNSLIYSYGHRNPQGLAFHPETGELWSTEHGPSEEQGCCMDEINRILPGRNYGWPVIRGSQEQAGMETPVYHSGDTATWAPTGGVFVTQGEWKGSLLFTGLRGQALYRAVFSTADPSKIETVERYYHKTFGRLRNVLEGPDGRIYIAVSNQDGRGDPSSSDDKIIVATRQQVAKFKTPLP